MQLSATVWEDADLPMVTTQWRNGGIDGERNPQILIPFELLDPVVSSLWTWQLCEPISSFCNLNQFITGLLSFVSGVLTNEAS